MSFHHKINGFYVCNGLFGILQQSTYGYKGVNTLYSVCYAHCLKIRNSKERVLYKISV